VNAVEPFSKSAFHTLDPGIEDNDFYRPISDIPSVMQRVDHLGQGFPRLDAFCSPVV
jgi:hypothetical protein